MDLKSKLYKEQQSAKKQGIAYDKKTSIEVSLKELNFSIVSPVVHKKKKNSVPRRKEIAFISIGNLGFT